MRTYFCTIGINTYVIVANSIESAIAKCTADAGMAPRLVTVEEK